MAVNFWQLTESIPSGLRCPTGVRINSKQTPFPTDALKLLLNLLPWNRKWQCIAQAMDNRLWDIHVMEMKTLNQIHWIALHNSTDLLASPYSQKFRDVIGFVAHALTSSNSDGHSMKNKMSHQPTPHWLNTSDRHVPSPECAGMWKSHYIGTSKEVQWNEISVA